MPSASKIQIGVSRPPKWPRKMTRMPTWNRLEPQVSCAAAQQLARSAAPGVLLAVEAQHAAEQEHGQAEIGIPAVDDVVDQFVHDRFLIGAAEWCGICRHVRRGTHAAADARDQPVLAAVIGAGAKADRLVLPGGIERRHVSCIRIGQRQQRGDFRLLRLCRRKRDQRAEYAFIRRAALAQPLGHGGKMCAGCARVSRASAAGSVETNSRNSGRKSGNSAASGRGRLSRIAP